MQVMNRGMIKRVISGLILAAGLVEVAHAAYTVPSKYKGKCAAGYYNLVTEPADVPANYTGTVKEYALPSNVCVRRVDDKNKNMIENFSRTDFVVIRGSAASPFVPFASGYFESWASYEPILGHYNGYYSYTDSNNPRSPTFNDFSGPHPVFVSKFARAALKVKDGIYYFDKQTQVRGGVKGRCPEGYSTVGDSVLCYSKKNGLRLNSNNKVELFELGSFTKYMTDQECPLGYMTANGFGSSRGICTEVRALFEGVEKFGVPVVRNSAACAGGEHTRDGVTCLPEFTAIYCDMNRTAQLSFKNYAYGSGRHVYYWPTTMVNNNNALIDFRSKYSTITTGSVAISELRKGLALFNNDDAHITISAVDSGNFPVFRLYSYWSCDKLWDNGGWSMEPMPTAW